MKDMIVRRAKTWMGGKTWMDGEANKIDKFIFDVMRTVQGVRVQ